MAALVVVVFVIWFVPWVFLLKGESLTVDRSMPSARGKNGSKPSFEVEQVEVGPGTRDWTPCNQMPKYVPLAFVAAEDNLFFEHSGFDFSAIKDSFTDNLESGEIRRGGSTITQQVVKISLLSHERSYVRKAREAFGAVLLELFFSKEEILCWYVNLAEMGPGIYGVKSAARTYFGKSPGQLTVSESVQLATVLPSPRKWSAGLRQRNLTEFGQKRFAGIVTNMRLNGFISLSQWTGAMASGDFGAPISVWPRAFDEAVRKLRQAAAPTPAPSPPVAETPAAEVPDEDKAIATEADAEEPMPSEEPAAKVEDELELEEEFEETDEAS